MSDRWVMSYINQERERCAELVKLIRDEPDFLLYCITAPVYPAELAGSLIDEQRKRFAEFSVEDDFEDLM